MEDLCDNLLDDILFRLPLKSVLTCKSISKRFNTFISDPGFEAKLNREFCETTSPFKLLAYCSGLLLLRLSKKSFLVLNPVTKRHQFIENKKSMLLSGWLWNQSLPPCTATSYNFSDALPIYSHGSLHWIRKCNDILAFHVKKREARIIELPRNLPLPFVNWTSWFGVVNGLLTIISTSREEISAWILSDYKNVEWVPKTRITKILNSEWSIRIPSFYDGERLVMLQRKLGEDGEVCMYDITTDKWRKIGMSCRALDRNRAFVPFVPSLAEIKTRMWPDVPTPVVQSIDNLSLLVSFKGSDSA
ncbi:putative F-box protein At1g20800 [Quercus robur]|uniref:putative F-box protein At1g20800 n=1 Tax=Quercus robur TaxID=38942 RepID=UPI002161A9EA|nr:putative F-box protein At1g20800 [Quercus robur]